MPNTPPAPSSGSPKTPNDESSPAVEIMDCSKEDFANYPEIEFFTTFDALVAQHKQIKEKYCAAPLAQ
jgi:hypothetical protein